MNESREPTIHGKHNAIVRRTVILVSSPVDPLLLILLRDHYFSLDIFNGYCALDALGMSIKVDTTVRNLVAHVSHQGIMRLLYPQVGRSGH
jgi:hypothetical protein